MHAAKAAVLLLAVLFFTPVHAIVVAPTIYDQVDVDYGTAMEYFTYSMSVDCTAGTISITALDGSGKPVEGAQTYLQYVDVYSSLIAAGRTDGNGFILDKLPGSAERMHGIFTLTLEKSGFYDKDVDFDISGCYSNETAVTATEPTVGENTSAQQPGITVPALTTTNTTDDGNVTGLAAQPGAGAGMDFGETALLVMLAVAIIGIWAFYKRKS
jgi:hypothetical protein